MEHDGRDGTVLKGSNRIQGRQKEPIPSTDETRLRGGVRKEK